MSALLWIIPVMVGVTMYNNQTRGAKFGKKRPSGNLQRWFEEKWVDVCSPLPGGGFKPCGRRGGTTKRKYPYCRPLKRRGKGTPKTAGEIIKEVGGRGKLKQLCERKHKKKTKTLKHRWEK